MKITAFIRDKLRVERLPKINGRAPLLQTAVVLLVLVPIGFAGFYGYRSSEQEMTQTVFSRRDSISYLIATVLTEKFDRLIDVGVSLSTRVRFVQLIENGQWNDAIQIMRSVPATLSYVERVFLADPNGVLMADTPAAPGVRDKNFSERDWYKGVSTIGKPYVSNIYRRTAQPQMDVVAVAVPVMSEAHKQLGILVLQIKLSAFVEWFTDASSSASWNIYIVDRNGRAAFQSNGTTQTQVADLSAWPAVQRALGGIRGAGVVTGLDGEPHVSAHTPVTRYGWGVVLDQTAVSAFASRDMQLQRFAATFGVMLLLGACAIFLLLRARHDARMKVELEKRVAERTVELEASNKELEAFSYSVSHDLRAPLRSIDGFSRILMDDFKGKLDAQQEGHLHRIRAAAKRMGELIDDLLRLSRVTRTEIKRDAVNLSELAQQVTDEITRAQPERRINTTIQPGLVVEGDQPLLRVMLENLIGNAWKFTSKESNPTIELGATRDDAGETVYYVRDNGAGFDMDYMDKLFGAFQRLHSPDEFPGTGIGLATVQRIVRRLGGNIWAESRIGSGATFYFTLPAPRRTKRNTRKIAA
jgi:signal transduction histidine kinase